MKGEPLKNKKQAVMNLISNKNIGIMRWFFSNPYSSLRDLYSFAAVKSSGMNVSRMIDDNIDYIVLITFEDFCKKFGLKVEKDDIVVKYPPILRGTPESFYSELYILCCLAKTINAKKIFEIGTYEGKTIANISHNVADDADLFTLDFSQAEIIGRFIRDDKRASGMVKIFSGSSLTFDFSPFYDEINLMYIDGGHTYRCALLDSENAVKCVKDGGFIVWHDFFNNKGYLGLVQAIFEICRNYNFVLHWIDGTRFVIAQNIKKNLGDVKKNA